MQLSARNQLKGNITNINSDDVTAEIVVDVGGQEVCSTITTESMKRLGLQVGDEITADIKASNVIITK
jgi:molybdopterin-binding protein